MASSNVHVRHALLFGVLFALVTIVLGFVLFLGAFDFLPLVFIEAWLALPFLLTMAGMSMGAILATMLLVYSALGTGIYALISWAARSTRTLLHERTPLGQGPGASSGSHR